MLVETEQIIPITQLQRKLTQTVSKLSKDKEPVFIIKNNNMEAVMMPFERYEYLSKLEEIFEHTEIYSIVKERLAHYDADKSVSFDLIKG